MENYRIHEEKTRNDELGRIETFYVLQEKKKGLFGREFWEDYLIYTPSQRFSDVRFYKRAEFQSLKKAKKYLKYLESAEGLYSKF